jgi:hypothetical protein
MTHTLDPNDTCAKQTWVDARLDEMTYEDMFDYLDAPYDDYTLEEVRDECEKLLLIDWIDECYNRHCGD